MNLPHRIFLKDGTPVRIRLVRPTDKACIQSGFQRLTEKSRYQRFLSFRPQLTSDQLKFLTEIDNIRHLAIGAADMSQADRPGIAIARYIQIQDEPDVAEVAITVIDAYQNKGLGGKLTEMIMQLARQNGFHKLGGYVLENNIRMLSIFRRLGAHIHWEGTAQLRVEIDLSETLERAAIA